MTAPRISMPDGKPESGTVFFVYRAKMHTGSSGLCNIGRPAALACRRMCPS